MRRRDFIAVLAGAAAIGPQAVAQPASSRSVGILHSSTFDASRDNFAAFESSLAEAGFVKGQNVAFEYRLANNDSGRLNVLASELVRRGVDVILAGADVAAVLAAKTATSSIPIVFAIGADPVRTGIVASLAQPGGNVTGITSLAGELSSKRLQLLHELVPKAKSVGYLVNPAAPAFSEAGLKSNAEIARSVGLELVIVRASTLEEIEKGFMILAQSKVDALLLGADTTFGSLRHQIIALADKYAIPASYAVREFVEAGGLSSYSTDNLAVYRQCGAYVARVLRGEATRNLPVQLPTRFKFVVNARSANRIGLELSPALLARADEVID